MTASELERLFLQQIALTGLPLPETEYRFHPTRRWRFDGAYPDRKIAYEVEGGVWSKGRHTRGAGYTGDCVKYNEATLLGWQVYRFTGDMIDDGTAIQYLEYAIGEKQCSEK
jgi:hypothetical protein